MDGATRGHLVREAIGWGIPSALAQGTVEEVLERLRSASTRPPFRSG